ncbi:hypothetical protein TNCV_1093871 [Trichonephila clavipes]|uniref:Uncharacterized protein n=1 Tax=Trichonephila clavipes TaxID=2585209 RepID=A0A8X6RQQ5_TRICX|nr:hypothetical protein TNCV_1093871 [Trichonephila clavipes]
MPSYAEQMTIFSGHHFSCRDDGRQNGNDKSHRTWGHKPRFVGVTRKNSYEGCEVELNEKEQKDTRNAFIDAIQVYNTNNTSQLDVRNATTSDIHGNSTKLLSHIGHNTADTNVRRIVRRVHTNSEMSAKVMTIHAVLVVLVSQTQTISCCPEEEIKRTEVRDNKDFELVDKERAGISQQFKGKDLEELFDQGACQKLAERGKLLLVEEPIV